MDSLAGKRDPEFGSLESEDMDELMVAGGQTLFSAEACEDFRPRSSTWHGPNRPQLLSQAALAVDCASPFPPSGGASDDMDFDSAAAAEGSAGAAATPATVEGAARIVSGGSGTKSAGVSPNERLLSQHQQQKRRNPWGSETYADLITRAIEASPRSRLTLSEIYDWMIKNVEYFSTKGDTISSNGWKNSVRHNLSLHSKFVRTQNEQTSKSSYWTIDYGVRDRASYRRRATTADAVSSGPDLQRKRLAALAKRRRSSGGGVQKSSEPAALSQTPPSPPDAPMQPELQISSVLHQLVPRDRLLDPNQPIETLLMESLSDAVLESAATPADAPTPSAGLEADEMPPLRSLTDQLHLMTCRQAAAAASASADDDRDGGHGGCGGGGGCWSAELCLPRIQEAATEQLEELP